MKKTFIFFLVCIIFFTLSISATEINILKKQRDDLKDIINNNEKIIYNYENLIIYNKASFQIYSNYIDIKKINGQIKTSYGIILDEIELLKEREYPTATEIWYQLKNFGYNNYVAAGILGNLMVETGGKTLKLNPYAYSSTKNYYGICQWSNKFYPKVQGTSLEYQLQFLFDTIEYEFKIFGNKYEKDFTYEKFCNLQDAEEAALAFAKVYERCAGGYNDRMSCATKAYEYYVS